MNISRFLFVMPTLCLALCARPSAAQPITLQNPSFDSPGFNDLNAIGGVDPNILTIHKWNATPASNQMGIFNPGNGEYIGATDTTPTSHIETEVGGTGVPDGSSIAFMYFGSAGGFTGALWQTTSAQFEKGTYTVTAYAGLPLAGTPYTFPDARIRLYAGTNITTGTLLKEQAVTAPTAGTFVQSTLTFGTNDANWATLFAAHQLEPLTIALYAGISGRQEVDWDLVTFDFVPEPGTVTLLGLGAVLLRRRIK